jgi:hypothetical protein
VPPTSMAFPFRNIGGDKLRLSVLFPKVRITFSGT